MMKSYLTILCLFILASCGGDRCIDADDFGFAQVKISAGYKSDELDTRSEGDQVAPWIDSGFRVNGRTLTIMVRGWSNGLDKNDRSELSAWCPWFAEKDNKILSSVCKRLGKCEFIGGNPCPYEDSYEAPINNAPCLLKNGMGLYAYIGKQISGLGDINPNDNVVTKAKPGQINFHVYGDDMYEMARNAKIRQVSGKVYKYEGGKDKEARGNKLYFKILDRYYTETNGQYKVIIKSGIEDTDLDPIEYATKLVRDKVFEGENSLVKKFYEGIIKNSSYRSAMAILLNIYLIYTVLSYLMGHIEMNRKELITICFKIVIISVLINTEASWHFFSNYLFVFFIQGVESIVRIIKEASEIGSGNGSIISLMMAPQTFTKLFSLLFVHWSGFIYIILFIWALFFVVYVFFKAAVIYLTATIIIAMIIVMAPIFLCFMLFGFTRSLFENWLKQLTSYAIQPIILFMGLSFISTMIASEIYGSLGFAVCKQTLFKLDGKGSFFSKSAEEERGEGLIDSLFYWWFPNPKDPNDFSTDPIDIRVPIAHVKKNEDGTTTYCDAYECVDSRYIEFPYLDPHNPQHQSKLERFQRGNFVQLETGLLIIFVCIYLLHQFNKLAANIGSFIANTGNNLTNFQAAADATSRGIVNDARRAYSGAQQAYNDYGKRIIGRVGRKALDTKLGKAISNSRAVQLAKSVKKTLLDNKVSKAIRFVGSAGFNLGKFVIVTIPTRSDDIIKLIDKKGSKVLKKIVSWPIDKIRIAQIRNSALSRFRSNKAVANEVLRQTGLKRSDIDPKAKEKYQEKLLEYLKKKYQDAPEKTLKSEAKKLAKLNYKDLEKALLHMEIGDKKISDAEKAKILAKLQKDNPDLRKAAQSAMLRKQYKNAYLEAHMALSERGIGMFGKRIGVLRAIQNGRYNKLERKRLQSERRLNRGQRIYSGYALIHKKLGLPTKAAAAFHEIMPEDETKKEHLRDKSKRTFAELLRDEQRDIAREKLNRKILKLKDKKGQDVLSPEFILEQERKNNGEKYRKLVKQDLEHRLHKKLVDTKRLLGKNHMKNHATVKELDELIKNIYINEAKLFKEDQFINKEDQYKERFQKIIDNLKKEKANIASITKRDNLTNSEMIGLLYDHYKNENLKNPELLRSIDETGKLKLTKNQLDHLKYLEKQVNDLDKLDKVLMDISKRKEVVSDQIDKYVNEAKLFRKEAYAREHGSLPNELVNKKVQDLGNSVITNNAKYNKIRDEYNDAFKRHANNRSKNLDGHKSITKADVAKPIAKFLKDKNISAKDLNEQTGIDINKFAKFLADSDKKGYDHGQFAKEMKEYNNKFKDVLNKYDGLDIQDKEKLLKTISDVSEKHHLGSSIALSIAKEKMNYAQANFLENSRNDSKELFKEYSKMNENHKEKHNIYIGKQQEYNDSLKKYQEEKASGFINKIDHKQMEINDVDDALRNDLSNRGLSYDGLGIQQSSASMESFSYLISKTDKISLNKEETILLDQYERRIQKLLNDDKLDISEKSAIVQSIEEVTKDHVHSEKFKSAHINHELQAAYKENKIAYDELNTNFNITSNNNTLYKSKDEYILSQQVGIDDNYKKLIEQEKTKKEELETIANKYSTDSERNDSLEYKKAVKEYTDHSKELNNYEQKVIKMAEESELLNNQYVIDEDYRLKVDDAYKAHEEFKNISEKYDKNKSDTDLSEKYETAKQNYHDANKEALNYAKAILDNSKDQSILSQKSSEDDTYHKLSDDYHKKLEEYESYKDNNADSFTMQKLENEYKDAEKSLHEFNEKATEEKKHLDILHKEYAINEDYATLADDYQAKKEIYEKEKEQFGDYDSLNTEEKIRYEQLEEGYETALADLVDYEREAVKRAEEQEKLDDAYLTDSMYHEAMDDYKEKQKEFFNIQEELDNSPEDPELMQEFVKKKEEYDNASEEIQNFHSDILGYDHKEVIDDKDIDVELDEPVYEFEEKTNNNAAFDDFNEEIIEEDNPIYQQFDESEYSNRNDHAEVVLDVDELDDYDIGDTKENITIDSDDDMISIQDKDESLFDWDDSGNDILEEDNSKFTKNEVDPRFYEEKLDQMEKVKDKTNDLLNKKYKLDDDEENNRSFRSIDDRKRK